MANSAKITFTANPGLKETLKALKDEYGFKSISAVIEDAVNSYKKLKESQKWEKAYELAAKDVEYQKFLDELSSDDGDLCEY